MFTLENATLPQLLELAVHDRDDQNYQDRDDGDGDYPIRSHPATHSVSEPAGEKTKDHHYLRAIPLNVFTLRSTYPSLSNN